MDLLNIIVEENRASKKELHALIENTLQFRENLAKNLKRLDEQLMQRILQLDSIQVEFGKKEEIIKMQKMQLVIDKLKATSI